MATQHRKIKSALGELTLVGEDGVLSGVYFRNHWTRPDRRTFGSPTLRGFEDAEQQLAEYLAGERTGFDLATQVVGDPFQLEVWKLIAEIPFGHTTTYGELAQALAGPSLARAVGAAVGSNPLSVIVPCHRVLGKGGKLTGYAGGLSRKRFLLDLEAGETARRHLTPHGDVTWMGVREPVTGERPARS